MRFILSFILGLVLVVQAVAQTAASDPQALADGVPAVGQLDIAEAWLIEPTTRYDHFVLGTSYSAGGLRVRTSDGAVLTLMLDDRFVFEDRRPRLADLDGDGKDEIVLVLSSVSEGASLAAYSVLGNQIVLKAKTPFIGTSHRWLNPAGIADYDGDGQLDVVFVAMPHLVQRLEMWTLGSHGFRRTMVAEGFSNHRNGSRHTGMSASADFDGDGVTDIAIPDADRRNIRVITFAGIGPREIKRLALPAAADGDFVLSQSGDGYKLRVPLSDGSTAELRL